jgi:hypothetical protein
MQLTGKAVLLRVFVGEADRVDHKPVYEIIVKAARDKFHCWCYSTARSYVIRSKHKNTYCTVDRNFEGSSFGDRNC